MSDPNTKTIYSPLGEKFEVTAANFRDLKTHAGWFEHAPHPDTVAAHKAKLEGTTAVAAAPVEPTPAVAAAPAAPAEDTPEADHEDEDNHEDEQSNDGERVLKTTPVEFADMDRPAVAAYIEATFPGTVIDGRTGRDTLVAKAIELANAEVNG